MSSQRINIAVIKDLASKIIPKEGHVWLYGSRARGTNTDESDWDLLILLEKEKL